MCVCEFLARSGVARRGSGEGVLRHKPGSNRERGVEEKEACRDLQQTLAKNTKRGDQLLAAYGCTAKSVLGRLEKSVEFGRGNTQKSFGGLVQKIF